MRTYIIYPNIIKLTTNNAVYITCFSFLFLDLLEPVYAFKEKPKASYAAQGTNHKSD